MKKYISLLIAVFVFGFSSFLSAQNLPAQLGKGFLKSGTESIATQTGYQVFREAALNSIREGLLTGTTETALSGALYSATVPVRTGSAPVRVGGVAVSTLQDFSFKDDGFFKQAKVFLSKRERFAGDPDTTVALERMRNADNVIQLAEIAQLDTVYPKLKKLSVNGMFAKFKYVGPEPSGVDVIKATDFTLMLEGPLPVPFMEEVLDLYPKAVVEKQHVGNLPAQVLWMRSGNPEELKSAVEDLMVHLYTQGLTLRLGTHEVTDFARTAKVHLHFEGFDEKGIFYNYTLFVDFANIRLPYNPITYDGDLTVLKALREADNVAAFGYDKLAEVQTLLLNTVTDILPIVEGTDAYERLVNVIMM